MENKTCTKCSQTKPLNEFRRDNSTKTGYRQPCQECNQKRAVKWKNSDSIKAKGFTNNSVYTKNEHSALRQKVLNAYGNKCACCGESEPKFLSVDHINNDGAAHRRELKTNSGGSFYRWLKRNGFPINNFQLLCHNCNFAKGLYGACPHKKQQ